MIVARPCAAAYVDKGERKRIRIYIGSHSRHNGIESGNKNRRDRRERRSARRYIEHISHGEFVAPEREPYAASPLAPKGIAHKVLIIRHCFAPEKRFLFIALPSIIYRSTISTQKKTKRLMIKYSICTKIYLTPEGARRKRFNVLYSVLSNVGVTCFMFACCKPFVVFT